MISEYPINERKFFLNIKFITAVFTIKFKNSY